MAMYAQVQRRIQLLVVGNIDKEIFYLIIWDKLIIVIAWTNKQAPIVGL